MIRMARLSSMFLMMILLLANTGCTTQQAGTQAAGLTPASTLETYTDPFAYCATVGQIDQPDSRYSGEKVNDEIVRGYLKAAGMDENADLPDAFKQATVWRCMDGKVYACNVGANLPCQEKADTSQTPTLEMKDYCKGNPGSDFIPMVVTGRATVYAWRCENDQPTVDKKISDVDAAGYLTYVWYRLEK